MTVTARYHEETGGTRRRYRIPAFACEFATTSICVTDCELVGIRMTRSASRIYP